MQNLLLFLIRYGTFMTFLLLEAICIYLLVQNNDHQNEIFLYSSNLAAGSLYDKFHDVQEFVNLKEVNDSLASENARLKERLLAKPDSIFSALPQDSMPYQLIPAKVINNSISSRNNMLTLNKGSRHGVEKSMGVINEQGVIGVIKSVSKNYSTVISILNTDLKISAKIKRNNFFGTLSWSAIGVRTVQLEGIPKHSNINLGDTVATTSYSTIFPPDIPIGVVSDIKQPAGRSDFLLSVQLFPDLTNLSYTSVVRIKDKSEIFTLQNEDSSLR